ncbi:MAG TPA: winged helix DNA-binding domain-containing protein, partial [Intrasporangium sp.]|nr:winged helix DNA-binding domain-containing protein [Intrasporangium sp.]
TYHLVGHHCMTGLLCQGSLAGKQPTFVLIDQWVPLSRKPSREEAMTTVIERYLRSHGPATEKDIAGWIAGTLAFVREALELIGDRVTRQDVGGQAWLSHVDAPAAGDGPGGVHLLPQWDEFLLGYKSRDVTLPDEHVVKVVPGRNLVFQPTVVVDGEVAGVWKRQASTDVKDGKNTVVLEVTPLTRLTAKALRGLEASSAAYGRFLGRDVELRLAGD